MSKFLALVIVSALCVSALGIYNLELEDQWKAFKTTHRKLYSTVEDRYRIKVFEANLDLVKRYQEYNPEATYGVTKFSDLTPLEFKYHYLGLVKPVQASSVSAEDRNYYKPTVTDIPTNWSWKDQGAVTKVKNQGMCGSCWAFSTIGNIEGAHFLKNKELTLLSEQQLVDCDKIDEGCNGGYMQVAMQWLADHGGLATEDAYPYTGSDDTCKFTPSMAHVNVTGYRNISTDETEIAQSLYELGPLAIAVVADPWQFYIAGIANPWFCNGELDHGVLLVGYGYGKGIFSSSDYWLVKNSWGSSWGESGYIRLVRGEKVCGMNQDVSSAIVA